MNRSELKSSLHQFIDKIDNPYLLESWYREMKRIIASNKSGIWESLSKEEKGEILMSYEESEHENQLIANEDVMKDYKKWL